MGLVAEQLVKAMLEGRADPKRFLHRIRREQELAKQPKPYVPPRVHTEDCHDWDDWEDLETWQRIAAVEMQQDLETEFELSDFGLRHMTLDTQGASYVVYESDDVAEAAAIDDVEQQLDDEPGNFNQDWLQGFIDTDRLKEALMSDVEESNRSRYDDEWPDYESKRDGLIEQDKLDQDDFFDEEMNELEITPELERKIDEAYEEFITEVSEGELEDPMDYLENIYGREEAPKQAMSIVGINTREAAENAVSLDGWEHFLSHYDGNSTTLPSGSVYVRSN